jgi:hypothetical protein
VARWRRWSMLRPARLPAQSRGGSSDPAMVARLQDYATRYMTAESRRPADIADRRDPGPRAGARDQGSRHHALARSQGPLVPACSGGTAAGAKPGQWRYPGPACFSRVLVFSVRPRVLH